MLGSVAVVTVGVPVALWGQRAGRRPAAVWGKLVASAGFVVLGVARWGAGDPVGAWIVVGLLLSAAGDACLLFDRWFDAGIAAFLLGHVAYVVAFASALPPSRWPALVLLPVAGAAVAAGLWLWPYLGRRRPAVAAYITVISVMVWGAVSGALAGALPWTTGIGALAFYASDLLVARHRFVTARFVNRLAGLPLYYVGQLLIALTVGYR